MMDDRKTECDEGEVCDKEKGEEKEEIPNVTKTRVVLLIPLSSSAYIDTFHSHVVALLLLILLLLRLLLLLLAATNFRGAS